MKWKIATFSFLLLAHVIPIMYVLTLLLPESQQAIQNYPNHQEVHFQQAKSELSVEPPATSETPNYHVQLKTVSRTNIPAAKRQDMTLLYQDGLLVGATHQQKENVDTIVQQLEVNSKYNHLYQAVSFHHGYTGTHNTQEVSSDYLYVSVTKYGGLQSFHEPITLLQQNWKEAIDRGLEQMDAEWSQALEEFSLNPYSYYLFPLTQLASHTSHDWLPGVSSEKLLQLTQSISSAVYTNIVAPANLNNKDPLYLSSIPLILIDKKDLEIQIMYRTDDGHYHLLKEKES
ncbi:hypothetical protein [Ammoniphilus resinae]|nr:hypothetical protein [Ammoniphilus resinae]